MEFLALILFILATFLVFQKYIVRGLSGRWKDAGDALGQGRIYDPHKTLECAYYTPPQTLLSDLIPDTDGFYRPSREGFWYDRKWFEETCQTNPLTDRLLPSQSCHGLYDEGLLAEVGLGPCERCLLSRNWDNSVCAD